MISRTDFGFIVVCMISYDNNTYILFFYYSLNEQFYEILAYGFRTASFETLTREIRSSHDRVVAANRRSQNHCGRRVQTVQGCNCYDLR